LSERLEARLVVHVLTASGEDQKQCEDAASLQACNTSSITAEDFSPRG
jgi:hypothetical protein